MGVKPDPHCSPRERLWTDSELGGREVRVKSKPALCLPLCPLFSVSPSLCQSGSSWTLGPFVFSQKGNAK